MNSLKIILTTVTSVFYLTFSNAIMACSSCNVKFSYTQKQLDAYFGSTILMAAFPVSFMGILVYAVYRQSKSQKEN